MSITFLTEKQIWGDDRGNGQLQVLKAYGTKTGMSDLAIALGGLLSSVNSPKTRDGQRTGCVWSASSLGNGYVRAVNYDGDRIYYYPIKRFCGARPALPSSVASSIRLSEAKPSRKISGVANTEIDVVEYGEYPQTIVDEATSDGKRLQDVLETEWQANQLQLTGKHYRFRDAREEHPEYQYQGRRYVRVEATPYNDNSVLSSGRLIQNGDICWIEVQPIEWLVEPEGSPNAGTWVARQALFSGVQFDSKKCYDGIFENTDMSKFLNDVFWQDIQPARGVDHAVSAPSAQVAPAADAAVLPFVPPFVGVGIQSNSPVNVPDGVVVPKDLFDGVSPSQVVFAKECAR